MKTLKPILVLFLICSLLFPKSILHFMVHLPDIIEHFEEHKVYNNNSLADFITIHSTSQSKNEAEKHTDLPSNHEHSNIPDLQISVFNISLLQNFQIIVPNSKTIEIPATILFRKIDFLSAIFQPPRFL